MTKKTLTYTLVGEGFAEYQFIPRYVDWVAKQYGFTEVVRTRIQLPVSKNPSLSKVLAGAALYCNQAFENKQQPSDLFVLGIDLDEPDFTDELAIYTEKIRYVQQKMGNVYTTYADKISLYVPIQAIDYWILYIRQNATANSLEAVSKDEAKRRLYGKTNPDRRQIEKIVASIVSTADFSKLTKQSRSFNHFHQQVIQFFQRYTTPVA